MITLYTPMSEKNVLVVCGTSVATSTVVAEALKERLPEHGVELGTVAKAKASEAPGKASSSDYDLIVTTTSLNESRFDEPVIQTLAFMTGQGEEEAIEEIAEELKNS
jgi:PTS system galactitol-specific IIB component